MAEGICCLFACLDNWNISVNSKQKWSRSRYAHSHIHKPITWYIQALYTIWIHIRWWKQVLLGIRALCLFYSLATGKNVDSDGKINKMFSLFYFVGLIWNVTLTIEQQKNVLVFCTIDAPNIDSLHLHGKKKWKSIYKRIANIKWTFFVSFWIVSPLFAESERKKEKKQIQPTGTRIIAMFK